MKKALFLFASIFVATAALFSFPGIACAESSIILRFYDARIFYPYPGYSIDDTVGEDSAEPFTPTYRGRLIANVEFFTPQDSWMPTLFGILDVKLRSINEDRDGHGKPLSADMGLGGYWETVDKKLRLTLFGSSEHFFNSENNRQGYNYIEIRFGL